MHKWVADINQSQARGIPMFKRGLRSNKQSNYSSMYMRVAEFKQEKVGILLFIRGLLN